MLNPEAERQQLRVVTPRNFAIHRARIVNDPDTGCWLYRLPESTRGRPRITVSGITMEAYRFFWLCYTRSPVPDGKMLLHSCDRGEEGCVNPDHLRIGTHDENMRDKVQRNRQRNQHTGKTECSKGHALSEDNVYTRRDGSRECRICRAESKRKAAERRKAKGSISAAASSEPSATDSSEPDATTSTTPPTDTPDS